MQTIPTGLRVQLSHISKSQSRGFTLQQAHYNLSSPSIRCHSTNMLSRSRSFPSSHPTTPKQSVPLLAPQRTQHRDSSFLHDESIIPSKRQVQKRTARESYFTRRRREREARSKLSTLALSRDAMPFDAEGAFETQNETPSQPSSSTSSTSQEQPRNSKSQSISPRRRRLLLIGGILLLPVVGGDVVEAVLPGLLGVIIFVAGNIKAGVNWVRSIGSRGS